MIVIHDLHELKRPLKDVVLTIGNFDGVHLGHREIFRRLVSRARSYSGTSAVMTFVPHPLKVLAPGKTRPLINTYDEKERLIQASLIDVLFLLPFNHDFAALTAEEFVRDILVDRIGVRHLVVGYDYAFGREREGDVDFLRRMGEQFGFTLEVPPGDYALVMTVRDELAGKELEIREPFTVVSPAPEPPGRGSAVAPVASSP